MSNSSSADSPEETGGRRLLRRFARAQAMLGIPLIVVLFVLHLGLSSTSDTLIRTQFNYYQSNSVLQKSALGMAQARRAYESAANSGDAEQMYRAADMLVASLGLLNEGTWYAPGQRTAAAGFSVDTQKEAILRLHDEMTIAADSLAAGSVMPVLNDPSARLDALMLDFRELQAEHERSVFEIYTRLATQQQRYEWAVRATLFLLLTLYGSLTWLYVSQRRAMRELRKTRDAAEQATRAKSDFLAVMSHEIRTPMNGVIGVADLLESTELDARQREYVNLIRDSGSHLLRIIDDVLDFSRIEAEQIPLTEAPFDIRDVVTQVRTLLMGQVRSDVHLEVAIGEEVPPLILGDCTRHTQILTNLLNNALKFTHRGEIMLDIDATDRQELVIRVRDTGIGIDAQQITAIYQPFSQGDNSIIRAYGGTGLGLAITRRLVELMGGDITVRSVPGEGSEFVVHLPLRHPPADVAPVAEGAPMPAPQRSLNVLVVEDNPVNQMVTRRMLESLGHQVEIAVDGEEGVARARSGHYDLVFMDLQMPRMSGISAAEEIRRHGSRAKIVALSANALPEHRAAAESAGMSGFLAKPARLKDFEQLLQALFPASENVQAK